MSDETPWEPPLAGSETAHLLGALDRQRATFRYKTADLDATGLAVRIGSSTLTLGGLLKHLALVEDHCTTAKLSGEGLGEVWSEHDGTDEWEFVSAAEDSPADLYACWDDAVDRARARVAAALEDGGLDQEVHASDGDGQHASLRRLLFDLLEEYARHTGHADLLREHVDGRVGEDPPQGWSS